MREPPNIPDRLLLACLRDHYGLDAATLDFLPLGLDTNAGVYRVVSADGDAYLLKVKSTPLYEPGCHVPRYLRDHGVAAAVAPLPTTSGALWARTGERGEWAAILYPFIEGDRGWQPPMTDAQWRAIGAALSRIHAVAPPPERWPSIRTETFDPTAYSDEIRAFDARFSETEGGSPAERALRDRWREHQTTIHTLQAALETLAPALQQRAQPYVICHADLHPSNIIRAPDGRVFVIDWDDVMLAPKERDFLFTGDPPAPGAPPETASPFFQGYGPAEIDWAALTFYRCERVVTDVIVCAQDATRRDDLSEETRADIAHLFADVLAPGNMMLAAAWAAAAHLPGPSTMTVEHGPPPRIDLMPDRTRM